MPTWRSAKWRTRMGGIGRIADGVWRVPLAETRQRVLREQSALPGGRHALSIVEDFARAEKCGQAPHGAGHGAAGRLRGVRLGVDGVDGQHAALAVHLRIEAANEAVAVQDGEDVVAVLTLVLRHVDFHGVLEVEQLLRALAVADEVVERREQRSTPAHFARGASRYSVFRLESVEQGQVFGMNVPRAGPCLASISNLYSLDGPFGFEVGEDARQIGVATPDEVLGNVAGGGDAERAQRLLRGDPHEFALRQPVAGRPRRQEALTQVPQFLNPVAPGDHDLPADPQEVEHPADVAPRGPAGGDPRLGVEAVFFDVTREERAVAPNALEDVAPEFFVLPDPRAGAPAPGVGAHERAVERVVLGEDDGGAVSPVLEEPALLPEELIQVRRVVRAKAAEQHQLMAARDDADRVELQTAQVAHDFYHAIGIRLWERPGQALLSDGQAAGERGGKYRKVGHSGVKDYPCIELALYYGAPRKPNSLPEESHLCVTTTMPVRPNRPASAAAGAAWGKTSP